jgi:hypothetical protein
MGPQQKKTTSKKKMVIQQPNPQMIWILVMMKKMETWTLTVTQMRHKIHQQITFPADSFSF